MNKKLVGKYVQINHGNVFDKYKVFGKIVRVDDFGNIYLKINRIFGRTFFHHPRLFWWNPFFAKRESVWCDERDDPDDWNYKKGDIIDFPLKVEDWRIHHDIKEVEFEEEAKLLRKLHKLDSIKGGWYGFP